jgi:hypothetical protein
MFLGYNFRIMLKRLAILAVVLAVTCALVPVTGQTSDKSAHGTQKQNKAIDDGQGPSQSAPSILRKNEGDGNYQAKPNKTTDADQQAAVNISESAPVPESWSWHDKCLWVASLLLVVVGFLTLGILWRQTGHIISSERAWMSVVMENPPETYVPGSPLRLACHITNKGNTPAFLLEKGEGRRVLQVDINLPDALPQYAASTKWKGTGVLFPPTAEIAVALDLSVSEARTVYEGTHAIWFYGFLKYRDAFKKDRIVRYCFRYSLPDAGGVSSGFYPDGPDGYSYAD